MSNDQHLSIAVGVQTPIELRSNQPQSRPSWILLVLLYLDNDLHSSRFNCEEGLHPYGPPFFSLSKSPDFLLLAVQLRGVLLDLVYLDDLLLMAQLWGDSPFGVDPSRLFVAQLRRTPSI